MIFYRYFLLAKKLLQQLLKEKCVRRNYFLRLPKYPLCTIEYTINFSNNDNQNIITIK